MIRRAGKRKLAFASLSMTTLSCLLLGAYVLAGQEVPWIPTFLFSYCFFSAGLGVVPLPWILVSEIFPLE
jgi:MFS family permease